MNEKQRTEAQRLVTQFVARNQNYYDANYNANLKAAGELVKDKLSMGKSLHDIEAQATPEMALITAYVRQKLFPQGEILTGFPPPSILAEQELLRTAAAPVPAPVASEQHTFASWLFHRALRLPAPVARGLNRVLRLKPGTVESVNNAVAGTAATLAGGAVQGVEDKAAAEVAATIRQIGGRP